jgi:hypothetical protein
MGCSNLHESPNLNSYNVSRPDIHGPLLGALRYLVALLGWVVGDLLLLEGLSGWELELQVPLWHSRSFYLPLVPSHQNGDEPNS